MIALPKVLVDKFSDWLGREAVDTNRHGEYLEWLEVGDVVRYQQ